MEVKYSDLIKIFEKNAEESNSFIAEKACDIYKKGKSDSRNEICSYLLHCSDKIDFGNNTPNEVIRELISIIIGKNK